MKQIIKNTTRGIKLIKKYKLSKLKIIKYKLIDIPKIIPPEVGIFLECKLLEFTEA